MDQEHAADFNLLCSAKQLYTQTILETVFEKGKKKGRVLLFRDMLACVCVNIK